ncbi:hypothetical protein Ciccas_003320 [Cichlidogyrus casuarinus]|uniref:Uncharacterized protein n=1 Tax=Cichlidogyrus casuarinus TaxID=1844966 RepID=A0ABD2QEP3_9PLAT
MPTLVFVSQGVIHEKQLSRLHQSVLSFEEAETSAAAAKAFWQMTEGRSSQINEKRLFTDLWTNISSVNFAYRMHTSSQIIAELQNVDRPAKIHTAMLQIEPLAVAPDLFAESSEAADEAAKALQSTLPQVVAAPTAAAEIAIDWVHGLLYWLCSDCDSISVLTLEQRWRKTLIEGVELGHSALVLDPRLALIYFVIRRNASCAIAVAGSDGKVSVKDLALNE